jgi:hypothetical protein
VLVLTGVNHTFTSRVMSTGGGLDSMDLAFMFDNVEAELTRVDTQQYSTGQDGVRAN